MQSMIKMNSFLSALGRTCWNWWKLQVVRVNSLGASYCCVGTSASSGELPAQCTVLPGWWIKIVS